MSYIDTAHFSCITRTSVSNKSFTDDTASLDLWGDGDGCPGGWKYRAWLYPEGGGTPVMLADNLPQPYLKMPGTPLGAGHGTYAIVEFDPATGSGPLAVGMAINDERNSRGESGEAVGTAAWRRTEYIHVDHLGSTRVVTDEAGAIAATYKYYPFGLEADPSSGSDVRMKFTGHERDEDLKLDYMLARYYGASLGRLLSVDPVGGRLGVPQRWNRYAYVVNSPLKFIDPNGEDLHIAYDFSDAPTLNFRNQAAIIHGVREVFLNAGVETVSSYYVGSSAIPTSSELGDHDRVVTVTVTQELFGELSDGTLGRTEGSQSEVSTFHTPPGEAGLTQLVNTTAHEVGHGTGALPQYSADGSPWMPQNWAESGTIMETDVEPDELTTTREFSEGDSEQLRNALNEPESE